ncbi:hypothetical protein K0A97_01660 [Patescibacteria group bacterium]|nr:hypothetical protein [Patescibacteria group bacterium]
MNFINKILEGKEDLFLHLQFQKFSKGEFQNRALISATRVGEKYSIYTSAEFANELVIFLAKKLGSKKTKVTGAIISTNDLKGQIEFKEIKQFQGVKRYLIDKEMSGTEIQELILKFPKAFFALSFSFEETTLKIQPKAPKSGKPKTKESGDSKPNFCKIITKDKELGKSFIFEKPDFKKANINHTFLVKEIVIPEELKKTEDFARMREEAKRMGTIIRMAEIDGQEIKKEFKFSA